MGEVYRARDTKLQREVAVKILPAAFEHDADRLDRFMREAQALAALNHPHIAQVYGVQEFDREPRSGTTGAHAIIMELVEGPRSRTGWPEGRCRWRKALRSPGRSLTRSTRRTNATSCTAI